MCVNVSSKEEERRRGIFFEKKLKREASRFVLPTFLLFVSFFLSRTFSLCRGGMEREASRFVMPTFLLFSRSFSNFFVM